MDRTVSEELELSDDELLGEATLAKLTPKKDELAEEIDSDLVPPAETLAIPEAPETPEISEVSEVSEVPEALEVPEDLEASEAPAENEETA